MPVRGRAIREGTCRTIIYRIYKGSVRLVVTNVHYHHHHHYIRNPSLSLQSSQAYYDCNRHHWHQPPLAPNHRRLGNSVWQVTL